MLLTPLFIFGAKYLFIFSILIAGISFFLQPRLIQKKIALLSAVSGVLTLLVSRLAGSVYVNPRPFVVGNFAPLVSHVPDNGFPSDHALLVGLVAAVMYPFNRRVSGLLWFMATIVAVSRVYVGVHHVEDVIGSFVIATAMTISVYWFVERSPKKRSC